MSSEQPDENSAPPAAGRLDPGVRMLAAGPWTAELVGDELANICYRGRRVLRAVKAVVRDQDWHTLAPSVRDLDIAADGQGLAVSFNVGYAGYGARYAGRVCAALTPAALEVSFEGRAVADFRSNRIGLVVLPPPADAGRPVRVVHPGGGATPARFPVEISPHQPFLDIAALEWSDAGTSFRLAFTGDVFETEDQRNWTDASFKTYSTPLSRPFPVPVAEGSVVRQSLRLEAAGGAGPAPGTAEASAAATFTLGDPEARVPPLAVAAGGPPGALPPLTGLEAIVVELEGPGEGWPARLAPAAAEAARHGAGLDVRVAAAEPGRLVAALGDFLGRIRRLAVFDPASHVTEPGAWQELRPLLAAAGFRGGLLAGTRAHFTELNRSSARIPADADALVFSLTPQMHSTEVRHIIESVPMQRLVAQNALRLGAGRPVHVGPVTLRPRFNAVATTGGTGGAEHDELQGEPGGTGGAEHDELQGEPFTAAWTLASTASLSLEGVASVCYFEASGPGGLAASDGRLYPAGELLRQLAALRGAPVLSAQPDGPTPVTVYPVSTPEALLLFAANLSPAPSGARVLLPAGDQAAARAEVTAIGAPAGAAGTAALRGGSLSLDLPPWSTLVVRLRPASG
ncbi:hypothetical protein HER39_03580 [Arthrobacter deserti]|uniref:Uncharacterized protein n=1 Tax=Arthrobacter deserti TaxID=1742687 RepID=A0ABX1JK29_9MICC|nr:hypothetical protein [Arthrobacter deserti]